MTKISLPKQGQSDATEHKERGLAAAFKVNLTAFKGINARRGNRCTYWHFDLNSGCGINEEFDCIGSPLAFVRAADAVGVESYFAGFCDLNQDYLGTLGAMPQIATNPRCFRFHGDNASLVEAIPDLIRAQGENPKYAFGMVLSDPNGAGVPFDEMAALSDACPKLDFVINWNSRLFKLFQSREWGKGKHTLATATNLLNKRHWLIRKPLGSWRWTLMIGRNYRIGDHKALGFYHWDQPEGQAIFNACNYLNAENPDMVRLGSQQLSMGF